MPAKKAILKSLSTPPLAASVEDADRVFIDGLVIDASIGLYDEEMQKTQKVEISIEMHLLPADGPPTARNIVCYDKVSSEVKTLVASGHIYLVETLAEEIAQICLAHERVFRTTVSVAKPEAIDGAAGVGVQITRT